VDVSTLVINAAYIGIFSSTFMRTVTRLRICLFVSSLCFVAFGSIVSNWSMVGWNVVIGLMNAQQLIREAIARRRTVLSADEEAYRRRWFGELDSFDFASMWSMGEDVVLHDERMIDAGTTNTATSMVIEGTVDVHRPDQVVRLNAGSLVGEMSFVTGTPATASVDAVGTVRVRQWSHERLRTLEQLNPRASRAFHRLIEQDLARKVIGDVRPA
jgi:CRP-like cAMP-binding protein